MKLAGKTAIITAGAGGIGLTMAKRFAEYGANLCLCDVSDQAIDEASRELPDALILRSDVSKSQDVGHLFAAFSKRLERLDILVNNAGISSPTKPVEEITDAEWQATLN